MLKLKNEWNDLATCHLRFLYRNRVQLLNVIHTFVTLLILYIIDDSVISRCVKIRLTCSQWNLVFIVSRFICKVNEHLGYILLLLLLLLRLVAKAYSHYVRSEREKLPTDYKQCSLYPSCEICPSTVLLIFYVTVAMLLSIHLTRKVGIRLEPVTVNLQYADTRLQTGKCAQSTRCPPMNVVSCIYKTDIQYLARRMLGVCVGKVLPFFLHERT